MGCFHGSPAMGNAVLAKTEMEASLPVCVLQPSGEVAFRGSVPKASAVKELVLRISEVGLGPAHRLSLVLGTEILQGAQSLEQLDRRGEEELCLYLVRHAQIEFITCSDSVPGERLKCVLLGPAGVGKSALLAQYCHQTFAQTYVPTRREEEFRVDITTESQHFRFNLYLMDLPGEASRWGLTVIECGHATCIMTVFSLNSRDSLQEAVKMVRAIMIFHNPKGMLICLVGTHADSDQQEVSEEEAIAVADKLHCSYHAVSNATGEGVPEAFHSWLDQYLDQKHQRSHEKRSG